jgi:hypothetical protein
MIKSPLIKRLRTMGNSGWNPIGNEAADEIERLTAENGAVQTWYDENLASAGCNIDWCKLSDILNPASPELTRQGRRNKPL